VLILKKNSGAKGLKFAELRLCENFTYSLSAVHDVTVGDSSLLQLLPKLGLECTIESS
jgi:hypothetical protein